MQPDTLALVSQIVGDSAIIAFAVWRLMKADTVLERLLNDRSAYVEQAIEYFETQRDSDHEQPTSPPNKNTSN